MVLSCLAKEYSVAEQLFSLAYNGLLVEPSFKVVKPGEFRAETKPKSEWPSGIEAASVTLEVFTTPIDAYVELEDELHQRKGQTVKLGEVATRTESGNLVEVRAEMGNLYDIFCVANREDGTGALVGGGRYAVTDNPEYALPASLTFDEAKFFGYTALGLTREQAEDVDVTVTPMSGWGNILPGRFIIAGLELGGAAAGNSKAGMMVTHLGGVEFYHGRNAAGTLEAAGLARER